MTRKGRYLRFGVAVVIGVSAPAVSAANAHGCAPERYCPPWRTECGRYDCDHFRDCGPARTCYYGPADPPPRHEWRADEPWAPGRSLWLSHNNADPPPPARRPDLPGDEAEQLKTDAEEVDGAMRPRRKEKIPQQYQQAENTIGHTLSAIKAGASLYREHCAVCHGAAGEGDGPRAQSLSPPMRSLPFTLEQAHSTDAYLLWTIMEGGEEVGTEKPAFKKQLTTAQAWQIIAYMRAGFPAESPANPLRQSRQRQTRNTLEPAR